jgi:hypothetical protein
LSAIAIAGLLDRSRYTIRIAICAPGLFSPFSKIIATVEKIASEVSEVKLAWG